jgi:hypothetical protein
MARTEKEIHMKEREGRGGATKRGNEVTDHFYLLAYKMIFFR